MQREAWAEKLTNAPEQEGKEEHSGTGYCTQPEGDTETHLSRLSSHLSVIRWASRVNYCASRIWTPISGESLEREDGAVIALQTMSMTQRWTLWQGLGLRVLSE